MKSTIKLLKLNASLISDAEAEIRTIDDLPYYPKFGAYKEKEQDLLKANVKLEGLRAQRLILIEKLEIQVRKEKETLLKLITDAKAA